MVDRTLPMNAIDARTVRALGTEIGVGTLFSQDRVSLSNVQGERLLLNTLGLAFVQQFSPTQLRSWTPIRKCRSDGSTRACFAQSRLVQLMCVSVLLLTYVFCLD